MGFFCSFSKQSSSSPSLSLSLRAMAPIKLRALHLGIIWLLVADMLHQQRLQGYNKSERFYDFSTLRN